MVVTDYNSLNKIGIHVPLLIQKNKQINGKIKFFHTTKMSRKCKSNDRFKTLATIIGIIQTRNIMGQ